MVLKQAFNAITRIHSRPANLKRGGTIDIYSPVRITPSNYFRYLDGPSQSTVHGREFIMPIDSMLGHATQRITFDVVPVSGAYILTYDGVDTVPILWDDTFAEVETALQGIPALANVTVTGDYTDGFLVVFTGIQNPVTLISTLDTPPLSDGANDVVITITASYESPWNPRLKRGDKILDTVYGNMAIDEIVEMVDVGGDIMGYRVRVE